MFRLLIALALFSTLARADEAPSGAPAPDRAAEAVAVQGWGEAHPDCAEWTDACVVCTKAGCSTPGIACAPQETVCKR